MSDIYRHACEVTVGPWRDRWAIRLTDPAETPVLACDDRTQLTRTLELGGWRPVGDGRWYRNQTGYRQGMAPDVEVVRG